MAYPLIILVGGTGYSETGVWKDSTLKSYNDSPSRYAETVGAEAVFVAPEYAPETGSYDVFVWFPVSTSNATQVKYSLETTKGTWIRTVNQRENGGMWVKLATIAGEAGAGIIVRVTSLMSGSGNFTRSGAVRIVATTAAAEPTGAASAGQDTTTVRILLNQAGFDIGRPKFATVTNVADGTPFQVKKASDNSVVDFGTVSKQKAVFSSFNPGGPPAEYYVECAGVRSDNFTIGKFWIHRVCTVLAEKFMIEARSDTFEKGQKGIGTRDSHQFAREMESLALQYMANPSLFERLPRNVTHLSDCKFPELRVQTEPNIVWMMKFLALAYYDLGAVQGKKLHALTKAQLPFFLILYPEIKSYVSEAFYRQIRDFTVAIWSEPTSSGEGITDWFEPGPGGDNNLFDVQKIIGDIKGAKPPGYAIWPNLLMYEIALRDGLPNAQAYFDAAYANAAWLVNSVNLADPRYTKGQRTSEQVTITSLAYFLERYPDKAPPGTQAKIEAWIDLMIKRSNNMWDFRKYADPAAGDSLDQWTGGITTNEPGNVAGFPGIAFAARRVAGTAAQKARLVELAFSHFNHVFGQNPLAVHFSHDAAREIPGVERGWPTEYPGVGAGVLAAVPFSLEGAPKETAYPNAPGASPGYTEDWVSHVTPFIGSLAYTATDDTELKVFNSTFSQEIASAAPGDVVGVRLRAPLNFDSQVIETGQVQMSTSAGGSSSITVTEGSPDDEYFYGTVTVPEGASFLYFSYGINFFSHQVRITISSSGGVVGSMSRVPKKTPVKTSSGRLTRNMVGLVEGGGGGPVVNPLGNTWKGKKAKTIGNSIPFGQGVQPNEIFHQVVKDMLELASMDKYGYPGVQWTYLGSGTDDSISSKRSTWDLTGIDLIMLYGGANDLRLHAKIGTINDTTNATFYGAFNVSIPVIKAKAPNAKIVLLTSVQRDGGTAAAPDDTSKVIDIDYVNLEGHKLEDYNNALKALGRKYNLRVVDLFNGSAISKETIGTYMQADKVHPNAAGHRAMAYPIVGTVASLPLGADPMPGAPAATDNTPPNAPTGLTSTAKTSSSVTLSWTAATDPAGANGATPTGVVGYEVYVGSETTPRATPTGTSATISGLNPATPHSFTVKAKDGQGNKSSASSALSVTTDPASTGGGGTTPTVYLDAKFDGVTTINGSQDATGKTLEAVGPWAVGGSGAAYLTGTSANARILADISQTNYVVECAIAVGAAGNNPSGARVHVRYLDVDNNLFVQYDTANYWRLFLRTTESLAANGGNSTLLGTSGAAGAWAAKVAGTDAPDTWDKLLIEVNNNQITVYKNSLASTPLIGPVTVPELANVTKVGLGSASQNQPRWDNLKAYSVPVA